MDTKTCSLCKLDFPIDEFRIVKKAKGFRTSHCRACSAKYLREWRKANKDRLLAERKARYELETDADREARRLAQRESYAKDPRRFRDRNLRAQFGITIDQYDAMLAEQDGLCAICGLKCTSGRQLAVDHDHKTGAVRGLLCGNCNRALGHLQDDLRNARAAVAYLEKWS